MALLDDIGDHLIAQGVAEGADGYKLRQGTLSDTPDEVVAIFETTGGEPDQVTGTQHDFPGLQVRVRGLEQRSGGAGWYSDARAKAQAAFDALNNATISGLIYIFAVQSAPANFQDSNRRQNFTQNFTIMKAR